MDSRRNRRTRFSLSEQCCQNLGHIVLPQEGIERAAEERFHKFLAKEGLTDHPYLNDDTDPDVAKERRHNLFAFVSGGLAAAAVILSLQVIFGQEVKKKVSPEKQTVLVIKNTASDSPLQHGARIKSYFPRL